MPSYSPSHLYFLLVFSGKHLGDGSNAHQVMVPHTNYLTIYA